MFYRSLLMITVTVLMTACATSPGDDLPPYGETLRNTMAAQTWEDGDTTPSLQGDRATEIMETYRNRQAAPAVTE